MTLDEKKNSEKKQVLEGPIDSRIAEALADRRKGNTLSCAEAFDIAKKLNVPTIDVGRAMDQMEIKINKCRLGLFGHKDGKRVTPDTQVSETLREALSPFRKNRRMPCIRAYEIARDLNIGRPAVANACEALGIKVTPCQLGAF
jgi:hypothetical protein